MTTLLIHMPHVPGTGTGTLFGGLPAMPRDTPFTWPTCKRCKGALQFLGRIAILADDQRPERFALLFMCNNRPGLCEEWDPDAGGNFVLFVPARNAELLESAPTEKSVRQPVYGAAISTVLEPDYDRARDQWAKANSKSARQVLGSFRSEPTWVQSPFIPTCDACGLEMQVLAQLEEGPVDETSMNFGGDGCAYVFDCSCGSNVGKIHTQCG